MRDLLFIPHPHGAPERGNRNEQQALYDCKPHGGKRALPRELPGAGVGDYNRPVVGVLQPEQVLGKGGLHEELRDGVFYAVLAFDGGVEVSARPSDAIALALRMSSPIFVEDEVVRKANGLKFDDKVESSEKLRKWLESLRPDDFGKYKM